VLASATASLGLFVTGFIGLFVLAGIGNGSTYTMIPAIFRRSALRKVAEGMERAAAMAWARRISGAAIGLISAVGAVGGLLINLAFRQSFQATGSGVPAFWSFLAFYAVCAVVTYAVYLSQPAQIRTGAVEAVPVRV
jgi:MFS transporter, NNP family, nitrate/nitrite transporter